ncbi:MAG: ABC transporter ATP-binding protein [Lachnospira sp.]|nr:ABC transporter ATP-binding protein [Lachnospira sp.]
MNKYKRFFSYLGKWKVPYFLILAATLLVTGTLSFGNSYANKMMFNSVEYGNRQLFVKACILLCILLVVAVLMPYLRLFHMQVVRKVVFKIKVEMFEKLTVTDMQYFEQHHSGDTLKRLGWDGASLKDAYFSNVFRVSNLLFNGVVSVASMFYYDWKLAIVSIVFSIISVVISIGINTTIGKISDHLEEQIAKLYEKLSDVLSGLPIIKMYSGGKLAIDGYVHENDQAARQLKKRARTMSALSGILFVTGMLANFGTIAVGVYLVMKNEIDYGTVMAVVTLQMAVSGSLQYIGMAFAGLQAALATAKRVFDFLEHSECEELGKEKVIDIHPEEGIQVNHVTFAYADRPPVFQDFSFNVGQNEKLMILGESGCGKSSILKLLLRFYDYEAGEIRILGHDIREYSLYQLRKLITYVPQENYLFEGTIAENIAFGNPHATKEEVIAAAKLAYADEFIKDFPNQYETMMTASGKNVSGGQRQRIALARAFIKNAPIVFLDEPSSALDVDSEQKINLAIKTLVQNRIVIMVTHRTTSFSEFDRVLKIS